MIFLNTYDIEKKMVKEKSNLRARGNWTSNTEPKMEIKTR